MTISDLLFLALLLGTVFSLAMTSVALLRHKRGAAVRYGVATVLIWMLYVGVGTVVALRTPQRVLSMNDAVCFDEMCFRVTEVDRRHSLQSGGHQFTTQGVFYVVTIQVFSRSKGVRQRERGAVASLMDFNQNRYKPSPQLDLPAGYVRSLDAMLEPSQSVLTQLVFEVPDWVRKPGLTIGHDYRLNPALIIVGDDQHFMHRPTVIQLNK
jgi:hypothetical protein